MKTISFNSFIYFVITDFSETQSDILGRIFSPLGVLILTVRAISSSPGLIQVPNESVECL